MIGIINNLFGRYWNMFFGYFLKMFGIFKGRGGVIERLKKKIFNIWYLIMINKVERGGVIDLR